MDVDKAELLLGIEPQAACDEIKQHFMNSGFAVHSFTSPENCLSLIKQHRPDLLMLSARHAAFDVAALVSEVAAEDRGLGVTIVAQAAEESVIADLLEKEIGRAHV